MRVVPFLVLGSASSGTVIVRVRTRAGLYVRGPISGTGLCHFLFGPSLNFVRIEQRLEGESESDFLTVLTAKSVFFFYVHYGKVPYIVFRVAKFCVRP